MTRTGQVPATQLERDALIRHLRHADPHTQYALTADTVTIAQITELLIFPASNDTPKPETVGAIGVAGTATTVSRADHVHAMPGLATIALPGFMSAADKALLDSVTAQSQRQGPPGAAGQDGEDGQTIQGPTGLAGAAGGSGPPAADGDDGDDGIPGRDGAAGARGTDGRPGADGADGDDAPIVPGPTGATGSAGSNGAAGAAGADGRPGADGADGDEGQSGAPGASGATGANGSNGAAGATGAGGRPGADGEDGADGIPMPGPTGAPGANGSNGSNGAAGAGGPPGFSGEDGGDADSSRMDTGSFAIAEWWAKIAAGPTNNITATATAERNRVNYLTGAVANYDIALTTAIAGDVVGFVVGERTVASFAYRINVGAGVKIGERTQYLTLISGNSVLLYYTGIRWLVLSIELDTPWVDAGVIPITAVTTSPTKGTTTADKLIWRRVGHSIHVIYHFNQTTGGTAGTGTYLLGLPLSVVINSALTGSAPDGDAWDIRWSKAGLGNALVTTVSANPTQGVLFVRSTAPANTLGFTGVTAAGTAGFLWSSTVLQLSGATVGFFADAMIPIVDW